MGAVTVADSCYAGSRDQLSQQSGDTQPNLSLVYPSGATIHEDFLLAVGSSAGGLNRGQDAACGKVKRKLKTPTVRKDWNILLLFISLSFTFYPQPNFAESIIIEASIPVGKEPKRALTVPQRDEVYVTNWKDDAVSVINIKKDKTDAPSIVVGSHPEALARSPDGSRVYVGCQGISEGQRTSKAGVSIIDTGIGKVIKFIPLSDVVQDLAITPDGQKIYVADRYAGLWKINTSDFSFSCVDPTLCPIAVALSPNGEFAYVNYQCAPYPGTHGHDPIVVFDTRTDRPITTITHRHDGKKMANVGGFLTISPDGTQLWAFGCDACSLKSYDFEGCPDLNGESPEGRAIVNIVDTLRRTSEAKPFRGHDFGKKAELSAITASFFPDGTQIAVSTGSRILIFDSRTLNQTATIEGIAFAGNLAFSPDEMRAYVPMPRENCVKVLRLRATPVIRGILSWYSNQWENSTGQMLKWHLAIFALLWAGVSINFARTFADIPVLRMPIDLDVFVRKQRSKLVKLYLTQLGENIRNDQQTAEIKPVPLTVNVTRGKECFPITTQKLIDEMVENLRSPSHHRIAIKGDGGTGKTVIIQQLILRLIESGYVPMLLKAGGYGTRGDNPEAETMDTWIVRTLTQARVPVSANVWRSLPKLVFVIDQASEVRQKLTGAFWDMVAAQSDAGAANVRMVVAGRDIGDPSTGSGTGLLWEETVQPAELKDGDISAIGRVYLDRTGRSQEIEAFPQTIRGILNKPTAFLVSHYAKRLKATIAPVTNQGQLFEAILEAYAGAGQLGTRPEIVKQVLANLVKWNFVILGRSHDRGLPESQSLRDQVLEIFNGLRLKEKYGEGEIPTPAGFVDKLMPSGLIYRLGGRYFFFHDLFEDWLASEARKLPICPVTPKLNQAATQHCPDR